MSGHPVERITMNKYIWIFIGFCVLCLLALLIGLLESAHRQSDAERRAEERRQWEEATRRRLAELAKEDETDDKA